MTRGRFDYPVEAVLTGVSDFFKRKDNVRPLTEGDRLDGKTCLITGANSGVGLAVAREFARRGAHLLMACRSGIPEVGEALRRQTGSPSIEMLRVDLSDLHSIYALCDTLQARGVQLDVTVCNAGVAPPHARCTPQGLDEMFMVNYLAKFILLERLLRDGTIPNAVFGGNPRPPGAPRPRIIFTSSDSHRGSTPIDFDSFGRFEEYGVRRSIQLYGYYKLVLNTYATELSRRLNLDGKVDVGVFPMCPGPVDTNIIRDAPLLLKGFMSFVFKVFFQSPEKAAAPLVYLAAAPEVEGTTNRYLHMMTEKPMDEKTYDPEAGRRLWECSAELLARLLREHPPNNS